MEVTRTLPCALTDAEVIDRLREAASRDRRIIQHEDRLGELKEETATVKGQIDHELVEMRRLVNVANNREEPRPVKCQWSYDLASNSATLTRIDIGEVVETRAMTKEERQREEQPPLPGLAKRVVERMLSDPDGLENLRPKKGEPSVTVGHDGKSVTLHADGRTETTDADGKTTMTTKKPASKKGGGKKA